MQNVSETAGASQSSNSIPNPETWLDCYPFTETDLEKVVPGAPGRFLVRALYSGDASGLAALMPLIPNLDSKVNATHARKAWLEELQQKMVQKVAAYTDYVFKRWNQLMIADSAGFDADYFVNQVALAGLFINQGPLEFDGDQKTFFKYETGTGIWRGVADAEVRLDLLNFLVPFVSKYPGYIKPDKRLLDSLTDCASALAFRPAPNRSKCILHVGNGMLHVDQEGKNHQRRDFSPAYSSRNRVPVEYDPDKTYPNKFVNFLKCSLSDEDIELLQNWCGMALLGKNLFHKVLLLSGEAGSGKSQLVDVIEAIIGQDNVGTLVADRLEDRFELSGFLGKTLLVAKDVRESFLQSRAVHVIKSLSGDRGIKVEIKHSNRRATLEGPFNILIASNADLLVQLQGDAGAWARRLLIIPFDRKKMLAERKMKEPGTVPDYGKKLFEEEGPAILNWMLKGAWRVNQAQLKGQGFPMKLAQDQRTRDLLAASDPLKKFIEESLERAEGENRTTVEIYERYQDFCDDKVLDSMDRATFARKLKPAMFECLESKHGEVLDATGKRAKGYRNIRFKLAPGQAGQANGAASAPNGADGTNGASQANGSNGARTVTPARPATPAKGANGTSQTNGDNGSDSATRQHGKAPTANSPA